MKRRRKVRTKSSHHGPYGLGYTRATMEHTKSSDSVSWSKPLKGFVFGLQAATRLYEVGITSNRESARHGEFVNGSCTHRPSHAGSALCFKNFLSLSFIRVLL